MVAHPAPNNFEYQNANFPHDFGKPLVFPRSISAYQIPIEPLPAYTQHFAAKCNSSFPLAVFCFYGDEFHSLPFADFRRLAAKKALASARNSFSSFSRRISFSCCFTCLRRVFNSSARLIAVCSVCAPPPMSKRPLFGSLDPSVQRIYRYPQFDRCFRGSYFIR